MGFRKTGFYFCWVWQKKTLTRIWWYIEYIYLYICSNGQCVYVNTIITLSLDGRFEDVCNVVLFINCSLWSVCKNLVYIAQPLPSFVFFFFGRFSLYILHVTHCVKREAIYAWKNIYGPNLLLLLSSCYLCLI